MSTHALGGTMTVRRLDDGGVEFQKGSAWWPLDGAQFATLSGLITDGTLSAPEATQEEMEET